MEAEAFTCQCRQVTALHILGGLGRRVVMSLTRKAHIFFFWGGEYGRIVTAASTCACCKPTQMTLSLILGAGFVCAGCALSAVYGKVKGGHDPHHVESEQTQFV